jgi:hypothetical protein
MAADAQGTRYGVCERRGAQAFEDLGVSADGGRPRRGELVHPPGSHALGAIIREQNIQRVTR